MQNIRVVRFRNTSYVIGDVDLVLGDDRVLTFAFPMCFRGWMSRRVMDILEAYEQGEYTKIGLDESLVDAISSGKMVLLDEVVHMVTTLSYMKALIIDLPDPKLEYVSAADVSRPIISGVQCIPPDMLSVGVLPSKWHEFAMQPDAAPTYDSIDLLLQYHKYWHKREPDSDQWTHYELLLKPIIVNPACIYSGGPWTFEDLLEVWAESVLYMHYKLYPNKEQEAKKPFTCNLSPGSSYTYINLDYMFLKHNDTNNALLKICGFLDIPTPTPTIKFLFHATTFPCAEAILRNGIDLSKCSSKKDFGCGFYLNENLCDGDFSAWWFSKKGVQIDTIMVYAVDVQRYENELTHYTLRNQEWEEVVHHRSDFDHLTTTHRRNEHFPCQRDNTNEHRWCATWPKLYLPQCGGGEYDVVRGAISYETGYGQRPANYTTQYVLKSQKAAEWMHPNHFQFLIHFEPWPEHHLQPRRGN